MCYTCYVGPLVYEAWWCGKLSIALTAPVPAGFDSLVLEA